MMTKVCITILAVVLFMVLMLPAVVLQSCKPMLRSSEQSQLPTQAPQTVIKLYHHKTKQIEQLALEEYIKGVVAAEMPAEFQDEALKAQAVAARTYAISHMKAFGGNGLAQTEADISDDIQVGQAWLSTAELEDKWGKAAYAVYWPKISRAVDATMGIVATFQGELIRAVFHSTCGERTASAQEVWGFDYPYLQSVSCRWDSLSPRYHDTKHMALATAAETLGTDIDVRPVFGSSAGSRIEILEKTTSGRVQRVQIGQRTFSGQEVREKLNLRSTNFQMAIEDGQLVVTTIGYGHGVGLCQYGANGMAQEGRSYQDIIRYYYQGVTLAAIRDWQHGRNKSE